MSSSTICASILLKFTTKTLVFDSLSHSVLRLAVEEARVDLSVFRHVHLLLDQVPRLKRRVELEVKEEIMVRDYCVMLFCHALSS